MCLQGGLRGDDPEITLTAFVLIALSEAKQAGIRCTGQGSDIEVSRASKMICSVGCAIFPLQLTAVKGFFTSLSLWWVSAIGCYPGDSWVPEESSGDIGQETIHRGHCLVCAGPAGEASALWPDTAFTQSCSSRCPVHSHRESHLQRHQVTQVTFLYLTFLSGLHLLFTPPLIRSKCSAQANI